METLFAVLGIVLVLLDVYVLTVRPSEASPSIVTIALPVLIAAGVLTRPARERVAILSFAVMLAAWLNRAVVTPQILVHGVVLGGAALLVWRSYRSPTTGRASRIRLLVAACASIVGFVLVWLWRAMW